MSVFIASASARLVMEESGIMQHLDSTAVLSAFECGGISASFCHYYSTKSECEKETDRRI
jgi:hypothetical protein